MKTLQELYNEVMSSEELRNEYLEAAKDGKALDFIKSHGVDASVDEIRAFFEGLKEKDDELSEEELENAAGGTCNSSTAWESVISVFTVGVVCGLAAGLSALGSGGVKEDKNNPGNYTVTYGTHVGQKSDREGRLCNTSSGEGIF